MNRKLVAVGLAVAMLLPLFAMPAGAKPTTGTGTTPKVLPVPSAHVVDRAQLLARAAPASVPLITWTPAGTLAQAVDIPGGGAFAGRRVFIPGGYTAFTPTVTLYNYIQIYNGTAWSADTSQPIPAPGLQGLVGFAEGAVCADPATGKVYEVNGLTYDASANLYYIWSANQVYDPLAPAGSRWSFATNPSLADGTVYYSWDSGCAWIGGKMYLFGGFGTIDGGVTFDVQNLTWEYDPATDTWTDTGKPMMTGRYYMGYTNNSTTAYAAGGTDSAGVSTGSFDPVESTEYFTPAGGWVAGASFRRNQGRLAPGLSIVGTNLILYGGGTGNNTIGFTVQNTTMRCGGGCPSAGSWSNVAVTMATPRWFFGYATGNIGTAKFYAGGGDDSVMILGDAEKFTIP